MGVSGAESHGRMIEIPVCYGGEHGPDLVETAALRSMTPERLIELHTSTEYGVRFLGFSPGFAYLAGLPEAIHAPRLATPRPRIAAGSVGIAGSQTGIYPQATPGGWRLIGRTPLRMFDAARAEADGGATLVNLGDRVRFVAIPPERFEELHQKDAAFGSSMGAGKHTRVEHRRDACATRTVQTSPAITIIHPGHFTTIQDLGRPGHAAFGVPRSGAADHLSLRLGNRLVGNPDSAAALEMTLFGCTIECDASITIAITGSDAAATITRSNGSIVEIPRNQPVTLNPHERLKIAAMRTDARGYLCLAGGIDVPVVLGSRSTHVASGIGGFDGRALRAGDRLQLGHTTHAPATGSSTRDAASFVLDEIHDPTLILTPGPHAAIIPSIIARLSSAALTVTERADRSGIRLRSDVPLGTPPGDLLTEPMLPGGGSMQLTPSGEVIILGPDGPTTGGYPVIASVAEVCMPALGQLAPGDEVLCDFVTETAARSTAAAQLARLDELLPPVPDSDSA